MICKKCKKTFKKTSNKNICNKCNTENVLKWKKQNPKKVKTSNKLYYDGKKEVINTIRRKKYIKNRNVKKENWRIDEDGNKIYRIKLRNFRRYKTRFSVLARDKFTCQYCGRKAPEVVLEVDHIYPKSKGGLNEIKNYKTSCRDCNIGKGVDILEVI